MLAQVRARKNRVESRGQDHDFHGRKRASHEPKDTGITPSLKPQTDFAALRGTTPGITRFRLPDASADAATRDLLRRTHRYRTRHTAAAGGRCDRGRENAISPVRRSISPTFALDLGEQDELFMRGFMPPPANSVTGKPRPMARWPSSSAAIGKWRAMSARRWRKIRCRSSFPCHRVLAAGGKVGGFSAPGGADSKVRMPELEGVRVGPKESAQQSLL